MAKSPAEMKKPIDGTVCHKCKLNPGVYEKWSGLFRADGTKYIYYVCRDCHSRSMKKYMAVYRHTEKGQEVQRAASHKWYMKKIETLNG